MVSNVLLRLKPELALTLDADNYACGTYVATGLHFGRSMIKTVLFSTRGQEKAPSPQKLSMTFSRNICQSLRTVL